MIERPRHPLTGRYVPLDLENETLDHLAEDEQGLPRVWLSPRELEVLADMIEGATTIETANKFAVTPASVNNIRSSIYRKLQVSSPEDAIAAAAYLGLLDKDPELLAKARNKPVVNVGPRAAAPRAPAIKKGTPLEQAKYLFSALTPEDKARFVDDLEKGRFF